jgi:hypothetical protein
MEEIEEIRLYQFEGTLTEEWDGDDDSGHWQTVIRGENSDNLIRDFHQLLKSNMGEGEIVERRVLVRIELL